MLVPIMNPFHVLGFQFGGEKIPKSNSEQCAKLMLGSMSVAINIYKGNFTTQHTHTIT